MYTINKGVECIIIFNLSEQEMNLRKGMLITRTSNGRQKYSKY